jgi:methionine-rich copper-binding protein CopC
MQRLPLLAVAVASLGLAHPADAAQSGPAAAQSSAPSRPGATGLVSSRPRDGAVLENAPVELTLTFARPAALTGLTITPAGGQAFPVQVQSADPTPSVVAVIPALPPGAYQVRWTATGADGRPLQGVIRFTIRPPRGSPG